MRNGKLLAASLILVILATTSVVSWRLYRHSAAPPVTHTIASEAMHAVQKREMVLSVPHDDAFALAESLFRNERESYGRHSELPIAVYQRFYPTLGLDALKEILNEDEYCHAEAHSLGRLLYKETGRDLSYALSLSEETCASGLFHGALMEAFGDIHQLHGARLDAPEIRDFAINFCEDPKERPADVVKGDCIHAIGHAIAYLADYDLSSSLALCNAFPDVGGRYYCATGLYMQALESASDSPVRNEAPSVCGRNDYPAACYRYALRIPFKTDPKNILAYCDALPHGTERNGCFHGAGKILGNTINDTPSLLSTFCASANLTDRRMCVEGAVGHTASFEGQASTSAHICTTQKEPWRGWCEHATEVRNFGMERDFSTYAVQMK